jgi:hypothetical protein
MIKILMVIFVLIVAVVLALAFIGNGAAQQAVACGTNMVQHAIASCTGK